MTALRVISGVKYSRSVAVNSYQSRGGREVIVTKKLVLDVLKPLLPNTLEFARHLNSELPNVDVHVKVAGVDDKTQDVIITLTGELDYDHIHSVLGSLGASVHSIDEVLTIYVEPPPDKAD